MQVRAHHVQLSYRIVSYRPYHLLMNEHVLKTQYYEKTLYVLTSVRLSDCWLCVQFPRSSLRWTVRCCRFRRCCRCHANRSAQRVSKSSAFHILPFDRRLSPDSHNTPHQTDRLQPFHHVARNSFQTKALSNITVHVTCHDHKLRLRYLLHIFDKYVINIRNKTKTTSWSVLENNWFLDSGS